VSGRELYAGLHLLDRQLLDRDGRLSGNIDDLELTATPEGVVYVSAVISGPGALWYRMGQRRLGAWLRWHVGAAMSGDEPDPDRIPIALVSDIGSAVTISLDQPGLASSAAERWVRDHIIGHIPGSRHDADE
jgi:hypothetical protein